jgi:dTDP-D-glucose 4,6-dehydratase
MAKSIDNDGQHVPTNVLVTGGCGFIGSNFIRYAFHKKWPQANIVNVDKLILNSDCVYVPREVRQSGRYQCVLTDLHNRQILAQLLKENKVRYLQYLHHFIAFYTHAKPRKSSLGKLLFFIDNVIQLILLLIHIRSTQLCTSPPTVPANDATSTPKRRWRTML